MHSLVLCFSTEQGVCHLHSELNVLGLKTLVAISVSLWASIHSSPHPPDFVHNATDYLQRIESTAGRERELMVHRPGGGI